MFFKEVRLLMKKPPEGGDIDKGDQIPKKNEVDDKCINTRMLLGEDLATVMENECDAFMNLAEETPELAIQYVDKYKDQPYAKDVIEKVAKSDPDLALMYADLYKDQPYALQIIENAAKNKPTAALQYADRYKEQPYAKDIIKRAVTRVPELGLKYLDKYKDQSYVGEIIEKIAENFPRKIWFYIMDHSDEPYAKEVILFIAKEYPLFFLREKEESFIKVLVKPLFTNYEWNSLILQCQKVIDQINQRELFPNREITVDDIPIDANMLRIFLNSLIDNLEVYFGETNLYLGEFRDVFFSNSFIKFLNNNGPGNLTFMNAISIAKAVYMKIKRERKKIDEQNIERVLKDVFEKRQEVSNREIFGPNTKLILFSHEESRFDNEKILKKIYYRSGGKKENILCDAKGIEMKDKKTNIQKEKVLKAIKECKGPTTILFNGHGSYRYWAFSRNQPWKLIKGVENRPDAIDFVELGEALIASGNIKNINLIGCACFSYDYLTNLFNYLKSNGIKDRPFISIVSANKDNFSYGGGKRLDDRLLEAVYDRSADGDPILLKNFYKAEGDIWDYEDMALFAASDDGEFEFE